MKLTFDLYKAPLWKLQRLKEHYHDCVSEAHDAITQIDNVISSRANQKAYRARLKSYAHQYIEKSANKDRTALISQVMRDLSCTSKYASEVVAEAVKITKKQDTAKKHAQIVLLSEKLPQKEIANMYGITRQAVHKIIKKAR